MGGESRHRWLQSVFILKKISQISPYDAEEINSVFGCQHILCLKRSSMLSEPGILYRGNMEAAICVHPLLPPFLLLKCQAKITAAALAVHGQMQQGLPMLKRIKFLFVQSQLHNLLPGPVTGINLFLVPGSATQSLQSDRCHHSDRRFLSELPPLQGLH